MAQSYNHKIAEIVVAQLLREQGFDSAKASALASLADSLLNHIDFTVRTSRLYATAAHRSHITLPDLILTFRETESNLKSLVSYKNSAHNSFSHTLPLYPIRGNKRKVATFRSTGEAIPRWLPAYYFLPILPPSHTYKFTPTYHPKKGSHVLDTKQKREERAALVYLTEQCHSSKFSSISEDR